MSRKTHSNRSTPASGPAATARSAQPYARIGGLDYPPMTTDERLNEIARILALGIIRLRTRQKAKNLNNSNQLREFGLDFSAEQSVSGRSSAGSGEGR